jgi:hypothetical protein
VPNRYFFTRLPGEGFDVEGQWLPTEELSRAPLHTRYLRGLHWATGTLTGLSDIAQPTSRDQGIFTIMYEIIGIFYFACVPRAHAHLAQVIMVATCHCLPPDASRKKCTSIGLQPSGCTLDVQVHHWRARVDR